MRSNLPLTRWKVRAPSKDHDPFQGMLFKEEDEQEELESTSTVPIEPQLTPTTPDFRLRTDKEREKAPEEFDTKMSTFVGHPSVKKCHFPELMAELLAGRGMSDTGQVEDFLSPSIDRSFPIGHYPRDLPRACDIVLDAVLADQPIGIVCDYDTDGTSSGGILERVLSSTGVPVFARSPDRSRHGYGAHKELIADLAEKGCKVLITLDVGSTNKEEIEFAKKLGMRVIVIDHHVIRDEVRPDADALINPARPDCGFADRDLCAGGLTWIFARGLSHRAGEMNHLTPNPKLQTLADLDLRETQSLAGTATVGDVMPLLRGNRALVKEALPNIDKSSILGLRALFDELKLHGDIGAGDISFRISPCFNAAGRVARFEDFGRSGAEIVLELLRTTDRERAHELAKCLVDLNKQRQEIEDSSRLIVEQDIRGMGEIPEAIVVAHPSFHLGVVGIVCSRLVEQFSRTSLLFAPAGQGIWRGSMRVTPGDNAIELLKQCDDLLVQYGGHPAAGGCTILEENLPAFRQRMAYLCGENRKKRGGDFLYADKELPLSFVAENKKKLLADFSMFEPCGAANPYPTFVANHVRVVFRKVLRGDRHVIVTLQDPQGGLANAVRWHGARDPNLLEGKLIDVMYRPVRDKYERVQRGYSEADVQLIAVRRYSPLL